MTTTEVKLVNSKRQSPCIKKCSLERSLALIQRICKIMVIELLESQNETTKNVTLVL